MSLAQWCVANHQRLYDYEIEFVWWTGLRAVKLADGSFLELKDDEPKRVVAEEKYSLFKNAGIVSGDPSIAKIRTEKWRASN